MDEVAKPKRGLMALLANTSQGLPNAVPATAGNPAMAAAAVADAPQLSEVSIKTIRANPNQPRTDFDPVALGELVASIKAQGLVQPVVVRQLKQEEIVGEAKYELIAGERRWRASQIAGLTAIPVVVKKVFNDRDVLILSLIENLQRDDLNPVEEAHAYQRLAKMFNLSHEQIAEGVGKNRASISNALRVLELPSSVQDALRARHLSIGHAKVLLSIPDERIQTQLAAKVQAENLSVRDLERLVAATPESKPPQIRAKSKKGQRNARVAPAHIQEIEQQLREHFGTRVHVEEGLQKGRIVIEFYSVEDFERIVDAMGVNT
jgi:ParB family chromosome partitioning protein